MNGRYPTHDVFRTGHTRVLDVIATCAAKYDYERAKPAPWLAACGSHAALGLRIRGPSSETHRSLLWTYYRTRRVDRRTPQRLGADCTTWVVHSVQRSSFARVHRDLNCKHPKLSERIRQLFKLTTPLRHCDDSERSVHNTIRLLTCDKRQNDAAWFDRQRIFETPMKFFAQPDHNVL
jgi:hypothetical protein